MNETEKNASSGKDDSIETTLGNVLRVGTIVSAVVIALGGVVYLAASGSQAPHYEVFHGELSDLRSVAGIATTAAHLDPRGMIQFGLLLLVGTPIARVVGALVAFTLRRDRTYIVVSSLVLTALIYSVLAS